MIKVENNYLDNEILFNIQNITSNDTFLWSILNKEVTALIHYLVREQGKGLSLFTQDILNNILQKIKAKVVLEASIKLFTQGEKIIEYPQQNDFLKNKNYKTFILYLGGKDSYFKTAGYNKITTKENMAIFLDGPFKYINTNSINTKTVFLTIHYQ